MKFYKLLSGLVVTTFLGVVSYQVGTNVKNNNSGGGLNETNTFLDVKNDDKIVMIDSGHLHSGALSQNGEVFTWGSNFYGQLGDNRESGARSKVPINITSYLVDAGLDSENDKIVSISMGIWHSIALSQNGEVFTWGNNEDGELGDGSTAPKNIPTNITSHFVDAGLDSEDKIIDISLGNRFSSAISQDGKVFTWGKNGYGQLGDGSTEKKIYPQNITDGFNLSDDKITTIYLGYEHSSAISQNGEVFTWGYNAWGQLGDDKASGNQSEVPINITSNFNLDEDDQIINSSLGWFHSSTLSQNGKIFTWGRNNYGQIGDSTNEMQTLPVDITSRFTFNGDDKLIISSMGDSHSSAISQNGEVFTWGRNHYGQIGNDTIDEVIVPPTNITEYLDTAGLDDGDNIVDIFLGSNHSSTLSQNGEVFTWGWNQDGQLGDNQVSGNQSSVPLFISKATSNSILNKTIVYVETTEEDIKYKYEFDVTSEDNFNIPLLDENNNSTDYMMSIDGKILKDNQEVIFEAKIVEEKPEASETLNLSYVSYGNPFFDLEYETFDLVNFKEVNIVDPLKAKTEVIAGKTLSFEYESLNEKDVTDMIIDNVTYDVTYKSSESEKIVDQNISNGNTNNVNLSQKVYDVDSTKITISFDETLQLEPVVILDTEFITNYDELMVVIDMIKQPFNTNVKVVDGDTLNVEYTTSANSVLVNALDNITYDIVFKGVDNNKPTTQQVIHEELANNSQKEINLDRKVFNIVDVTITFNYSESSEFGIFRVLPAEFITNYDELVAYIGSIQKPFTANMDIANENTLMAEYTPTGDPSLIDIVDKIEYKISYKNGETQVVIHQNETLWTSYSATKEINLDWKIYDVTNVAIEISYDPSSGFDSFKIPEDEFISNFDDISEEINQARPTANENLIVILSVSLGVSFLIGAIVVYQVKWA